MRELYLNATGSRWVYDSAEQMQFVLVLPDGTRRIRKADFIESFGNFARIAYRYRGKRYFGIPKSPTGHDVRLDGESKLPHVFHVEG